MIKVVLTIIRIWIGIWLVNEPEVWIAPETVVSQSLEAKPDESYLDQIEVDHQPVLAQHWQNSRYKVIVDVSENQEYVYDRDQLIRTWSVSTGSATRYDIPYYTPLGYWKITDKIKTSGRFGPYFLKLDYFERDRFVATEIGLHGTDEPDWLGKDASHGCIRHANEVIKELFQLLPLGTMVVTVE